MGEIDKDIFNDYKHKFDPPESELAKLSLYQRLYIESQVQIAERLEMIAKLLRNMVEKP